MVIRHLLLCILLFQTIDGASLRPAPAPKKWLTLNGGQPEVIARGGESGFYPDSSGPAYIHAFSNSLPGTIMYCNLHFTKDNDGFCVAQINLRNTTTIEQFDPKGAKTYNINGHQIHGYFGVDYSSKDLMENVFLRQNIYSRPSIYDGKQFIGPFQILEDLDGNPLRDWLNIENDLFYKQFNISAEDFLVDVLQQMPEFLSSPEIGFLKSIGGKLGANKSKTKLIFTILGPNEVEPTTKTPYGTLIKDLGMIKSFASGILVPKECIWGVDEGNMLLPSSTGLVQEAHKQGLAVFASGFANDNVLSYNYSYDPAREYMQFLHNSQFSVDGVLTDFPKTPSAVLGCLNPDKKAPRVLNSLIISHDGASGDYPGSTDAAYYKAIEDGADIIDCAVQMSKDGVAFCSPRADIMRTTTAPTVFSDMAKNVTEIQSYQGVFSFDLTWSQILTLKPEIKNAFSDLPRNPANKHIGKFVTLAEFLELAKTKAVRGILLSVQNAAYLASKKSLDIVGAVTSALSKATLEKQQRVMIQSDDVAVLAQFKGNPSYERVLFMKEEMDAAEVKKNADAVFVHRRSVVLTKDSFIVNMTNIVPAFHAANLSVYVGVLRNEFINLAQNYESDPYTELSTLYNQQVDGFVTDFPLTANMFVRSPCTTQGSPYIIVPLVPGVNC